MWSRVVRPGTSRHALPFSHSMDKLMLHAQRPALGQPLTRLWGHPIPSHPIPSHPIPSHPIPSPGHHLRFGPLPLLRWGPCSALQNHVIICDLRTFPCQHLPKLCLHGVTKLPRLATAKPFPLLLLSVLLPRRFRKTCSGII